MAGPKRLEVVLGGTHAGRLLQNEHGRLSITYDDGYRRRRDATPLSLSMPLSRANYDHNTVDPFLRGLLPDSEAVLERWGRRFGVSANSPFALIAHVGEDVAGAVQFVVEDRLADATSPGSVQTVDEAYIAERIRVLGEDRAAWDDALAPGQFSLAGAQAKFALYRSPDGTWGLPSGRKATTHIFKPSLPYLADQDVNEHLCLVAAGKLGLRAARSEITQFGEQRAIVLRRYDRAVQSDGEVERIHQEDFCQALGFPPNRKYERDEGGPGVMQMVQLMRRVQSPAAALRSAEHFAKAMAFNWVIYAPDAHAKNYSILLRGQEAIPSPLYDISSVLPYPDRYQLRTMAMAMSVNGKYQNNLITGADWAILADQIGVHRERMATWVTDIAINAPDAFADAVAENAGWIKGLALAPALVDNVASHAHQLGRFLDGTPRSAARDSADHERSVLPEL
jgi:serine/threonine-protein kinase HipA